MTTVVVDALSVGLGGGLTYTGEQVAALRRVRPDLDLRVLAGPAGRTALEPSVGADVLEAVDLDGPARRVLWEQLRLVGRVPAGGVLHAPGNLAPLRPGAVPVVLVVQNPNAFGPGRDMPWNRSPRRRARIGAMRASVGAASRVVAVSQSMADLVVGDRPELADRVVVVQDGAPRWTATAAAPAGFGPEPGGYLLSVAQDWPHKRLDALVAAWGRAFAGHQDPTALVLAGDLPADRVAHQRALVGPDLLRSLVHLGPVHDRGQLRWLLEHAAASISVSALEAHPHGPAEAGALGCPLVLSDTAPHREVTAPAGPGQVAFVGVHDEDALVAAMRRPPADRTPWTWPTTWDDNARRVAGLFDDLAGSA